MVRFKDYFGFEINCSLVIDGIVFFRRSYRLGRGVREVCVFGFMYVLFDVIMIYLVSWIYIIYMLMVFILLIFVSLNLICFKI